ncbi:conserved hypothetical protein [Leishmania braziliensis MHOM/BR/75/M2904]|uniref:Uncharacterized protein n=2 Tax=Leishmania braziliensis TaxID=5660 RepID=E9AIS4_LEIBR|nr:conserved hypothetical protein [Leishmania braziliensis MHOM/BR/75/M2904]CAJ2475036.1 unnamed protein product [Leishmania braziliensis]CAJ2475540.1 unnamed protein product [Leishmania braziliensis]CBZ14735.1 conserved hypothetical protein [Leishmania braziliensis MHOM/BR/75/M2904]SYZ66945.1 hypothetical_protein [Leishmania braziliensis MHOM/BR/75/M2904]
MSAPRGERVAVAGDTNRSLTSSPPDDILSELTSHVSRSAITSYGARMPKESSESVLLRRRMEVMKTAAAIHANEDIFGGAHVSKHVRALPQMKPARRDKTRKPLYPTTFTNRYKTIADLKAEDGTQQAAGQLQRSSLVRDASGSLVPTESLHGIAITGSDPRQAVTEKYRAALVTYRQHVFTRIEHSIMSFSHSLGAVKPYAMSRAAKLGTRHCFADLPHDTNDRYVDRMQCYRPSKGLYTYY